MVPIVDVLNMHESVEMLGCRQSSLHLFDKMVFNLGFYFISFGQFFFFFLISNKDIYSRNYLMQKNIRQREKYNGREREKRKKEGKERILITQERAKEQREGITRGESPSPRPVK